MKVLPLLMLAMLGTAHAADPIYKPNDRTAGWAKQHQFVFNIGLQSGGDEIQRLVQADTGVVTDNIRGGDYWRVAAGGQFALGQSDFSLEVLGGLLGSTLTSNVNTDKGMIKRKIVEVIPFWHHGRSRFGLGVALHFDPLYHQNLDGDGGVGKIVMDDSAGAVLQWDYRWDSSLSVGLRYTFMEYDVIRLEEDGKSVAINEKLDGNALGFHVNWSF